ncbi:MAG: PKD domain-containing protein [Bacteroidales bacterium]|nr:PKD domain-containing protein [Bacteroidales bacterium]
MKKLLLLTGFLMMICTSSLLSQISQGGQPPSFTFPEQVSLVDNLVLSTPDIEYIRAEDEINANNGVLHRVGVSIPVDLNLNNAGNWTELRGGGRVWRLRIEVKSAEALGVYYNNFHLPVGTKLFLYNEDRTQVIGAFTSKNNTESGLFATELIKGDVVYLEYVEPIICMGEAKIEISEIAYIYRDVDYLYPERGFGDSDDACQVNINCTPEGTNWQDEKRGVARIMIKDGANYGWCSGSLINNVRQDCTPYFLTADHCGGSVSASDLNQWVFYFNFEAAGCPNPSTSPSYNSVVGGTFRANGGDEGATGSDFFLIELNSTLPDSWNPYYNGWNRANTSSSSGVGIHHPAGDIKKISTYTSNTASAQWNGNGVLSHWRLTWASTTNGHGCSEGGSSGSPLFDANGRIVGTLTGGSSTCDNPTWPDYYGKMSYHWDQNGVGSTNRLQPWLDPDNTGAMVLDGTNQPCGNNPPTADFVSDVNTVLTTGTVQFTDLSSSATSYSWVFSGGTPPTSTAANPSVVYNTAGTYDVALTVTNAYGNDTETKLGYITVMDELTSCDVLHYPLPGTATVYTTAGGYLVGNNEYEITAVSEYFDANDIVGYDRVEGVYLWIAKVVGNPATTVNVNVWNSNGTAGAPGTILGTKTVALGDLSNGMNWIEFDSPISISQPFYIGSTLPTTAQEAAGDTLAYISNVNGDVNPGTNWSNFGGTWYSMFDLAAINIQAGIFPYACPFDPAAPPVVNFYGSPQITFVNEPVDFEDYSLNDPTSWAWTFESGTPATSTAENPTGVTWAAPGFYDISLTATNANGSGNRLEQDYIEVRERTCEYITDAYTMGFETDEDFLEWTIVDVDEDESTWDYYQNATYANTGTGVAICLYNATNPSDDWLFTKCLTLDAGIQYRISFYYRVMSATYGPQNLEVYIGSAQDPATMSTLIVNHNAINNEAYAQSITTFTVPSSGNYYIGFHDYSIADRYGIALDDINIERYANPPIADFTSNYTYVCAGQTVSFADASLNAPTSWTWTFSGGTPASSSTQNPTVTYNTPGTYNVSLVATNGEGSDTESKIGYITVYANPSTTVSTTNVVCFGANNGTATANASGGATPYEYLWNNSAITSSISGLAAGTYSVELTDANGCTATASGTVTAPASALSVTASTTANIDCFGDNDGAITANISGGGTPYTVTWTGGLSGATQTGLAGGTYTVTVVDAFGCQLTSSTTVSSPSADLTATISTHNDVSCYGLCDGDATVSIMGGTSPYSITWAGSAGGQTTSTANNLCVGPYAVTVTDNNNCTATASVTISGPTQIVLTPSHTDATCGSANGQASVSVTGGSGTYTYDWSPDGFTGDGTNTYSNLSAGTYVIDVEDSDGCTASTSISISEAGGPSLSTSFVSPTCYGYTNGSATVSGTGGTGTYTFLWNVAAGSQTTATATNLGAGTYSVTVTDETPCSSTANVVITQPLQVTATIAQTNVSCNGANDGEAVATVTNGIGIISYQWSNGANTQTITGLNPGTYCVTPSDANGCSVSPAPCVTITEPAELTATYTSYYVSCYGGNDGEAYVNASGGTGPYTYTWQGSLTGASQSNLTAGTYTVTVNDANDCQTTVDVTISQPTEMQLEFSHTDATCGASDGTASVIVTGGTTPYTYYWSTTATSTSISGLAAGTYYFTATDANGCEATGSVTINNIGGADLTIDQTDVSCYGYSDGTATVTTSGGTSPFTYEWSSGGNAATETGLAAGLVTVTVSDANSCEAIISTTILEPDELSIVMTSTPEDPVGSSNGTATATVSGGTSGYSYLWSPGGGTNSTITGLAFGTYSVTVTDANNCQDTASVYVDFVDGISSQSQTPSYTIYPNPTTGRIIVSFVNLDAEIISVNDLIGKTVLRQKVNGDLVEINLSNLEQGVYFVSFVANGKTHISKVILTK